MNPSAGTFISMDTYQGNMYEPVTLHKYLYANANPVKYTDPSGNSGSSLMDISVANAIRAELYANQATVLNMSIMGGIANAAFTLITGGSLEDSALAALDGMLMGAGIGALCCVVAAITVVSLATVFAVMMVADTMVSIVMSVYCLAIGDEKNALIYTSLAAIGLINICLMCKVNYQVDVTGKKGTASFKGKNGSSSVDDIVDIIKSGEMTSDGRNIITQLDDNTKVIFRMDVGENAHSMDMYGYSNPVNYINIEIQVKASSGKYKPKWNFHMILDDFGEIIDSFATGIWTKK